MHQNFSLLPSYDHAALTAREKLHEFHKAAQHKKDAGETPAPVKTESGLFQDEGHPDGIVIGADETVIQGFD